MRNFGAGILVASAVGTVAERNAANPIRKVVTMLQRIQHDVEKEGERAEGLFKKFTCYCSSSGGDLKDSIASSTTKVPEVQASIEQAEAQAVQLSADLKKHNENREEAKQAIAESNGIREKEAAAFAGLKKEFETNIAAINKAVTALKKGASGAFLQTEAAEVLRKLVQSGASTDGERGELMSFVSSSEGASYAPGGGEVTGILEQMGERMAADLATATAKEENSIKSHDGLVAAKKKEIAANSKAIEEKLVRTGELKVRTAEMKNDLSDTEAALIADKKFLADLETKCSTASSDYEKSCKTRSEELLALADTIKLLNSDDALELFKKTLPAPNFMQFQAKSMNTKTQALALLRSAVYVKNRPELDLISLALRGKKVSFDKVIGMIDHMVGVLDQEQVDDASKKEYCNAQLDSLDDAKKGLERSISHSEIAIADAQDLLKTVVKDIAALEAGIRELDKSVAEAGAQRKDEHAAYVELITEDTAARKLLGLAINRLNKFYNPALHEAEPTLMSVAVRAHQQVAPPPAPAAPAAHAKKSEETNGVVAQLDALIADLDKEMQIAETEEKNAQADYEKTVQDAAAKRADDVKTLSDKKGAKADTAAAILDHKEDLASQQGEMMATSKVIQGLHGECDWLLKYFDVRKDARNSEIDSLTRAKAVLSGADYAFLQKSSLRGRR